MSEALGSLQPRQIRAVAALLRLGSAKKAAAEIGVSERTVNRWLAKPS